MFRLVSGVLVSGVACLSALLVCAACSSHSATTPTKVATPSSSGPTATPSTTVTVTQSSTPPTTAAAPASPSPSAGGSCTNAQLTIGHTEADGGDGHGGVILTFTNHSATECTLFGYPGAAGLNTAGTQIVQATRTLTGYLGGCRCSAPQTIPLAPGAVASSLLEGGTAGGPECVQVTALLVTPPDTTQSTRIDERIDDCQLQIHPVVTGPIGGNSH